MIESWSRRAFSGSSGTYHVRATELASQRDRKLKALNVSVVLLDDTEQGFQLEKRAKGSILLELVYQHLELVEKDYFGLQYVENDQGNNGNKPKIMRWLDPSKSVKKQLGNSQPKLYFRVKFYVSDPSKLQEEYTRYQFYLQVKKDIFHGRLQLPPSTACLLASYSVQSELGDYQSDEHGPNYLSGLQLMPGMNEDMERKISELHKLHKGQLPADAEFNFLDHAKKLDMYGVELHKAKDSTNRDIQLGVTSIGLVVFQNAIRINTFSWSKIMKISFKRRQFFIQLRREPSENYDTLLGFNMESYRSSKTLWKACVEHHTFFRLHSPKLRRRFPLSLSSRFHYSGKTEYQTVTEGKQRGRLERVFVRSPSRQLVTQPAIVAQSPSKLILAQSPAKVIVSQSPSKVLTAQSPSKVIVSQSPGRLAVRRSFITEERRLTLGQEDKKIGLSLEERKVVSLARSTRVSDNKVTSLAAREPKRAWEDDVALGEDDEGGFLDVRPPASITADMPFSPPLHARVQYVDASPTSPPSPQSPPTSPATPIIYDTPPYSPAPHLHDDTLVTIKLRPDDQGRFGFNVKGGADLGLPIVISKVAPNTPADRCIPRLSEGDQVICINGKDVQNAYHEEVVRLIKEARDLSRSGQLVLTIKPSVLYTSEDIEEPPYVYVPANETSSTPVGGDLLATSMLLLGDGLASGALVAQYEQLYRKHPDMCCEEARRPENINKNRYRDISPYDETRFILSTAPSGDYINANHITMAVPSAVTLRYVATQGPLPSTSDDFWHMVYESQSTLIVMLTTVVERGRTKCHKYWPSVGETLTLNEFSVACTREEVDGTGSCVFRDFILKDSKGERMVRHMQYVAWPDHGVPEEKEVFLNFTEKVREARRTDEPVIVHCSAGIGRTGVLILMETAMCLIEANEPVYPLDIVQSMREQRAMMIQNASQYRFVCECVHTAYSEGIVKPRLDHTT